MNANLHAYSLCKAINNRKLCLLILRQSTCILALKNNTSVRIISFCRQVRDCFTKRHLRLLCLFKRHLRFLFFSPCLRRSRSFRLRLRGTCSCQAFSIKHSQLLLCLTNPEVQIPFFLRLLNCLHSNPHAPGIGKRTLLHLHQPLLTHQLVKRHLCPFSLHQCPVLDVVAIVAKHGIIATPSRHLLRGCRAAQECHSIFLRCLFA